MSACLAILFGDFFGTCFGLVRYLFWTSFGNCAYLCVTFLLIKFPYISLQFPFNDIMSLLLLLLLLLLLRATCALAPAASIRQVDGTAIWYPFKRSLSTTKTPCLSCDLFVGMLGLWGRRSCRCWWKGRQSPSWALTGLGDCPVRPSVCMSVLAVCL